MSNCEHLIEWEWTLLSLTCQLPATKSVWCPVEAMWEIEQSCCLLQTLSMQHAYMKNTQYFHYTWERTTVDNILTELKAVSFFPLKLHNFIWIFIFVTITMKVDSFNPNWNLSSNLPVMFCPSSNTRSHKSRPVIANNCRSSRRHLRLTPMLKCSTLVL